MVLLLPVLLLLVISVEGVVGVLFSSDCNNNQQAATSTVVSPRPSQPPQFEAKQQIIQNSSAGKIALNRHKKSS